MLPELTDSAELTQLAQVFKRVKNIAKNLDEAAYHAAETRGEPMSALTEPAEVALLAELTRRRPTIERDIAAGDYRKAFSDAAALGPAVTTFFADVMVMAEDPDVQKARLRLMRQIQSLILQLADVSEMVPQSDN